MKDNVQIGSVQYYNNFPDLHIQITGVDLYGYSATVITQSKEFIDGWSIGALKKDLSLSTNWVLLKPKTKSHLPSWW